MPNIIFGQKHIHLESVDSSNSYANRLLLSEDPIEGTLISAGEQTNGRGQPGMEWISSPNENLCISLILKPGFLDLQDSFYLTIFSSLACADYVSLKLKHSERIAAIRIKWPNDLYIGNKKAAGILIENQVSGTRIRNTVLGIGMNLNQVFEDIPFSAVSLFELTGTRYDPLHEIKTLCGVLEKRYLQLRAGKTDRLKSDYLNLLFGKDALRSFRVDGKTIHGIITGVDPTGKLELQLEDEKKVFENKEIEFII